MANAQELLLIKEIIADGFDDLEAISFEMDIPMVTLLNIKRQIEIGSFRGIRHRKGLPVRGQSTKQNARTRKGPKRTVSRGKKG